MRVISTIFLIASSMAAGYAFGMPGHQDWVMLAGAVQTFSVAGLFCTRT